MNSSLVVNIVRAILLAFAQVLILKRIAFHFGEFAFVHFIVYPVVIMLLPINMPRPFSMLISFFLGLLIDGFYDSPGIHAAACVSTAYLRPYILSLLEPYEGYGNNVNPTIDGLGLPWFLTYASVILGIHLLVYFSIEAFSFVFLFEIVLNTIFSLIGSLVIIVLAMLIFNPRQ